MSTRDAQCLLAHIVESDRIAKLPEHWRHGRDGRLTYRFSGSSNAYTWGARAVEEVATRWLDLDVPRPDGVAPFIEAHTRLLAGLLRAGGPPPDAVYHDLDAGEVTAVWEDRKLMVIIDGVGATEAAAGAPVAS